MKISVKSLLKIQNTVSHNTYYIGYTTSNSVKIPMGVGNHRPVIEGQTTQWPKEKGQRDKQRSTKDYIEN